jgi:hypothetical protein
MPTLREHRENTATILTTIGELPPDATITQRLAAADALTDAQLLERSIRLLTALGYEAA